MERVSRTPSPTYSNRSLSPDGLINRFKMGDRVITRSLVGESKKGILRYIGPVDFAPGIWVGIECIYPVGNNDGSVKGREYFKCDHPYGVFVPAHKIEMSPINNKLGEKGNLYSGHEVGRRHYVRPDHDFWKAAM